MRVIRYSVVSARGLFAFSFYVLGQPIVKSFSVDYPLRDRTEMSGEPTHTGRRRGRASREIEQTTPQAIPEGERRKKTPHTERKNFKFLAEFLFHFGLFPRTVIKRICVSVFPDALVEDEGQKDGLRFLANDDAAERVTRSNESDPTNSGDVAGNGQHIPRRESMTSEELLGEAAELHPHEDDFEELDITGGLNDEDLETTKPVEKAARGKGEHYSPRR